MTVPVVSIDGNGIAAPLFTDVLSWLQAQYQSIYGEDINIAADTQDGQWLSVIASAIHDANMTIVDTYNAFSPTYAQGAGLSSVVKINGIRRLMSSTSTVNVLCVGQAGTDISGIALGDNLNLNTQWILPGTFGSGTLIIPPSGQVEATAVCSVSGSVGAGIGSITRILTPVPGFQTVTNDFPAVVGAPTENDAQLRRRQTISVANPSQTIVVGIQGAISNLEGVQRCMVYENPTAAPDANGIPAYSMAVVVEGGDAQAIANMIALRKTPGSPTFGTTNIMVYDVRGIPTRINFFELILVPITVQITVTALAGFTQTIQNNIQAQVVEFLSTLPIGYDSYLTKLIAATELPEPDGLTYDVTSVFQSRDGGPPQNIDVSVSFIEAAWADPTTVAVTVHLPSQQTGQTRRRR
jgi:uncharacterized phage protein gp47/JayE